MCRGDDPFKAVMVAKPFPIRQTATLHYTLDNIGTVLLGIDLFAIGVPEEV